MSILTAAQAAERLGVSVRRVQQLVKAGRLPAGEFGGSLMIQESDLALVEERKPGRPSKRLTKNEVTEKKIEKRSRKRKSE